MSFSGHSNTVPPVDRLQSRKHFVVFNFNLLQWFIIAVAGLCGSSVQWNCCKAHY